MKKSKSTIHIHGVNLFKASNINNQKDVQIYMLCHVGMYIKGYVPFRISKVNGYRIDLVTFHPMLVKPKCV